MAETRALRGLRGATTLDSDTEEQMNERVQTLLEKMLRSNEVDHDDLVSILFTATPDVHSMFPATAARGLGLGDVPLLCATEMDVSAATPLCIRILVHCYSERARADFHHIYLEGARGLRDDLPE